MVKMRGNRVGVEALKTSAKSQSVFSMPDDSNSVGVIKYVGDALADSDLKVGTKVYYGNQRQTITIDGVTILVMEETNIVARVEDVASEQKASA